MQHPAFISGNFDTHFVKIILTLPNWMTNKIEAEVAAMLATTLNSKGKVSVVIKALLVALNGERIGCLKIPFYYFPLPWKIIKTV